MGYRSDLDAAHARADALERKLAAGQDANEALRDELEDLKKPKPKPKKKKKVKAPKAAKAPRKKGALRAFFTPIAITLTASTLVAGGAGFWVYRSFDTYQEQAVAQDNRDHAILESFFAAWADQRYEDAWALMEADYRSKVSVEQFANGLKHHPSLRGVSGATLGDYGEGILHTSQGEVAFRAGAYHGEFRWMSADGFDLLPPSEPALISGHSFVRALIDKRFEDAWQYTHPIYRKSLSAKQFGESLAKNLWVTEATGFRLALADSETTTNELRGFLLMNEGSVGLVLNFTAGGETPWISEIIIGGKPTLPTP
jgi:hypothetical protein